MPALEIARCYYCGDPLPPRKPGRPGRPRRYCSDRCRKRDYDARRRRELEPAFPPGIELPALPSSPPPDELIARTIMDARAAAATFARLATIARRDFAWRCEATALEIDRTISEHFPGV